MKIDNELLYGPCPCGSGKSFKFCCWPKCRDELDGEFTHAELIARVRRAAGGEDTAVCNPEAEALCDEGEELWVDGERKKAWQFFVRARTVDPKVRVVWIHEAQCAWYEGYVETAHDTMKRGLEACPGRNAWEWALLAVFSHALGREEEATEWLERVLKDRSPISFINTHFHKDDPVGVYVSAYPTFNERGEVENVIILLLTNDYISNLNQEMEREMMAKMEGQIPLNEDERGSGRVDQPEDMT